MGSWVRGRICETRWVVRASKGQGWSGSGSCGRTPGSIGTCSSESWCGAACVGSPSSPQRAINLQIPEGRYLLADAGFGTCDTLLVPYQGI
ncbi:hypothetical protein PAXRUDRAFT_181351 [Paxillus rubicundulus Ve08.2h10]|uniref:DDE Tnp4 domain-containing protein n=1 Tax=Paxillus rubicundulus Ve08.2h10 TaxID=930991 RepID=A0A0D0D5F4_9AGAM|nr:hypothetical protein PAXRUDRAFT_181351 [Paxillus rubicundulus Ve08.2h10]